LRCGLERANRRGRCYDLSGIEAKLSEISPWRQKAGRLGASFAWSARRLKAAADSTWQAVAFERAGIVILLNMHDSLS
jgi:hypothetical protein